MKKKKRKQLDLRNATYDAMTELTCDLIALDSSLIIDENVLRWSNELNDMLDDKVEGVGWDEDIQWQIVDHCMLSDSPETITTDLTMIEHIRMTKKLYHKLRDKYGEDALF